MIDLPTYSLTLHFGHCHSRPDTIGDVVIFLFQQL